MLMYELIKVRLRADWPLSVLNSPVLRFFSMWLEPTTYFITSSIRFPRRNANLLFNCMSKYIGNYACSGKLNNWLLCFFISAKMMLQRLTRWKLMQCCHLWRKLLRRLRLRKTFWYFIINSSSLSSFAFKEVVLQIIIKLTAFSVMKWSFLTLKLLLWK